MPLGEIVGELFGGLFRVIGNFLLEIVIEVLVKGLGYLICRMFSKFVDPDSVLVIAIGLLAWVLIFVAFYAVYDYVSLQSDIDRCLDAGGSYNRETGACVE